MPFSIARNASKLLHCRLIHVSGCQLRPQAAPPVLSWSDFPAHVSDPSHNTQIYESSSVDPVWNLAVEHYLFQKTPPGSKILFFYQNDQCIVIGRNQNPWLEANLNLVEGFKRSAKEGEDVVSVPVIRRRSGGGTVFHDLGNVNWSVICDLSDFTRDRHAEMVVRALRKLGISRARVNERHDIVLDQGEGESEVDPEDTHITPFTTAPAKVPFLKVSGSAYKLARNRALHHGTALLQSPNLKKIPLYLRSPTKPFVSAKGVESVSSPVGNIEVSSLEFQAAVRRQFEALYGEASFEHLFPAAQYGDALNITEIQNGYRELKSNDWTFLQTPQFDIFSQPPVGGCPPRTSQKLSLTVKRGLIQSVDLGATRVEKASALTKALNNHELRKVDWVAHMRGQDLDEEVAFLTDVLPSTKHSAHTE